MRLGEASGAAVALAMPKLEILRDPRVGTFGALALVFAVALSLAALAPLDDGRFARAALVGHVLGRWSTLPQSLALPAARPGGSGACVRVGPAGLAAGTCVAFGTALLAGGVAGAIAVGVACAVTVVGGMSTLASSAPSAATPRRREQGRRDRRIRHPGRGVDC